MKIRTTKPVIIVRTGITVIETKGPGSYVPVTAQAIVEAECISGEIAKLDSSILLIDHAAIVSVLVRVKSMIVQTSKVRITLESTGRINEAAIEHWKSMAGIYLEVISE